MSDSPKFFWHYRKQEVYVAELLVYLEDKVNHGLVYRLVHNFKQHCFEVDTYANTYSNILFPEIERFSEGWTKYTVIPWVLNRISDDEWDPLKTFERWRNRPVLHKYPDTYVRVYIELIKQAKEETKDGYSS